MLKAQTLIKQTESKQAPNVFYYSTVVALAAFLTVTSLTAMKIRDTAAFENNFAFSGCVEQDNNNLRCSIALK